MRVRSQDACTRRLRLGFQGWGPPRRMRRRVRRPDPKRMKVQWMQSPYHVRKEGALCPCRRHGRAPARCGNTPHRRRPCVIDRKMLFKRGVCKFAGKPTFHIGNGPLKPCWKTHEGHDIATRPQSTHVLKILLERASYHKTIKIGIDFHIVPTYDYLPIILPVLYRDRPRTRPQGAS